MHHGKKVKGVKMLPNDNLNIKGYDLVPGHRANWNRLCQRSEENTQVEQLTAMANRRSAKGFESVVST